MINLSNFLIKCSGADKEILDQCTIKEKNKFIGIGSTLILTAFLASLSGGYAIYSTFDSFVISTIIGIFWGIVIFSLDRYIVTSIDKKGKWWNQLLTALPRLLIALVLAITISKPLELRLFQDAINKSMGEISDASISGCEKDWNEKLEKYEKIKSDLENARKQKTEEIYNKDGIYNDFVIDQEELKNINKGKQSSIYQNNPIIARGTFYSFVRRGDGSMIKTVKRNAAAINALNENKILKQNIADNNLKINEIETGKIERKKTLRTQVETTENQYAKDIEGAQQQIDDHNKERNIFLTECRTLAKNAKDLPAQLQALSKLTKENESIAWASLLITLLFVILETAPVVVKLLSSKGTYEEILETKEYEIRMEQKIIISNLNDEINTVLKISNEKNKNKLDAELKGNSELLNEIALAQADIAKVAVAKWKEDEIEKLKNSQNNHVNPVNNNSTNNNNNNV